MKSYQHSPTPARATPSQNRDGGAQWPLGLAIWPGPASDQAHREIGRCSASLPARGGRLCRRRKRPGSVYCWQHQPGRP